MRKKRVVHITQSMNRGGAEKLIFDLSIAACDEYDVYIICQYPEIDKDFKKKLREHGVNIILLNKEPGMSPKAMLSLYKTLSKIHPDVIHTHIQSAIYAIPYYCTHWKCKKIHTVHTVPEMEFTKNHIKLQGLAYKFLGVVPVAIGDEVQRRMKDVYGLSKDRVALIYNGVELNKFRCEKKAGNVFHIACVANFSKWKNQKMLIKTASLLDNSYKVSFAGAGDCLEECKRLAEELSVLDRVDFLGSVDDIPTLLANSDMLVLCSEFEGIPITIIEAFASSLPVVATNVGALPDLIKNEENGFLVSLNDCRQMAEKIKELHNDKLLYDRICKNNYEKSKEYDIKNVFLKYNKLYEGGWV